VVCILAEVVKDPPVRVGSDREAAMINRGFKSSHRMHGEWNGVWRERGAVTRTVGYETSAPVKDGVGEAGVYVGSFRATYSACRFQQRECVEKKEDVRFRLSLNYSSSRFQ
jgi:hypothetical protein